jgi:hypothetical protein
MNIKFKNNPSIVFYLIDADQYSVKNPCALLMFQIWVKDDYILEIINIEDKIAINYKDNLNIKQLRVLVENSLFREINEKRICIEDFNEIMDDHLLDDICYSIMERFRHFKGSEITGERFYLYLDE